MRFGKTLEGGHWHGAPCLGFKSERPEMLQTLDQWLRQSDNIDEMRLLRLLALSRGIEVA